jgi:hypothetical protein
MSLKLYARLTDLARIRAEGDAIVFVVTEKPFGDWVEIAEVTAWSGDPSVQDYASTTPPPDFYVSAGHEFTELSRNRPALTPDLIVAEDAAGGVFAAGALAAAGIPASPAPTRTFCEKCGGTLGLNGWQEEHRPGCPDFPL